jgi:hypothetical protein
MTALLILILVFAGSTEYFSRGGAEAQREFNNALAPLRPCVSNLSPQTGDVPIEVFQVLDLPLSIHEASLTKIGRGNFLRLALGNSSDVKIIGLRYSLVSIDARNQVEIRVNRTEGFSVPAYGMKTLTFKTPIKLKQKDGERFLLMIEQVVSRESIWEVVKAKDTLEAYASGDYSVVPTVLRVPNQVDAPPIGRPIRFERK